MPLRRLLREEKVSVADVKFRVGNAPTWVFHLKKVFGTKGTLVKIKGGMAIFYSE